MDTEELYSYATNINNDCSIDKRMSLCKKLYNQGIFKKEILYFLKTIYQNDKINHFKQIYNICVSSINNNCEIPDFDELPLIFFQSYNSTYFVYDSNTDEIIGPIKTYSASIVQNDEEVEYLPLLVAEQWDLTELYQLFSINRYGNTYFVITDDIRRKYFYSFLQLEDISTYISNIHQIYVYESKYALYSQLLMHQERSLPQNIICDESFVDMEKITKELISICHKRISEKSTVKPILSICIPTYDRGKLALEKVHLLQQLNYDNEIEVVVSDNAGKNGCEYYNKIKEITRQDRRIVYSKNEKNIQFIGNLWKVISMAQADHSLLISDEDYVNTKALPHYLGLLLKYPKIGVIRSSGNQFYIPQNINNEYYKAGSDAINAYYMVNNYLSGVIYNTKAIPDNLKDEFQAAFNNNEAYRHYPHMFLDMYICNRYDMLYDKQLLFLCGESVGYEEYTESTGQMTYMTKESRLMQQIGFVQMINEIKDIDDATRINLYAKACKKTLFLLKLNKLSSDSWEDCVCKYQENSRKAFNYLYLDNKSYVNTEILNAIIEELSVL